MPWSRRYLLKSVDEPYSFSFFFSLRLKSTEANLKRDKSKEYEVNTLESDNCLELRRQVISF